MQLRRVEIETATKVKKKKKFKTFVLAHLAYL